MAPWFRSSTNRRAPPRIPSGDVGTIEPSLSAYLPPTDNLKAVYELTNKAVVDPVQHYANGYAELRTPVLQIPVGDVGISDDCSTAIALEIDSRSHRDAIQVDSEERSMRTMWSGSHGEGDAMLGPLPLPSEETDSHDNSPNVSPESSFRDINSASVPSRPHIEAYVQELAPQYGRHVADVDPVLDHDERYPQRARSVDFPYPHYSPLQDSVDQASQRRLKKRSVSFSSLSAVYDVTPYSEVYGDHPKNFNFDSRGNKVSSTMERLDACNSMSMQAEVLSFGVTSPMLYDRSVDPHISHGSYE